MYDVLIIGAGMSGLAAGIRLAQFGVRVAILERHTTIGGLNSFYRLGGRNYDVGLHAVTNFQPKGAKHGPLPRVLAATAVLVGRVRAGAPNEPPPSRFRACRFEFSNDFALLESEVARQFPDQIDNFRRLVAALIPYDESGLPAFRRLRRARYSAS